MEIKMLTAFHTFKSIRQFSTRTENNEAEFLKKIGTDIAHYQIKSDHMKFFGFIALAETYNAKSYELYNTAHKNYSTEDFSIIKNAYEDVVIRPRAYSNELRLTALRRKGQTIGNYFNEYLINISRGLDEHAAISKKVGLKLYNEAFEEYKHSSKDIEVIIASVLETQEKLTPEKKPSSFRP